MVRIRSEPPGDEEGIVAQLLRLQSEFAARLADETLRYVRGLQGALGPLSPGTVVGPDGDVELSAEGRPGAEVELRLEVENRQRAYCVVTPALSPLVDASGTTWFPLVEAAPVTALVAPGEVAGLSLRVALPRDLPEGRYQGVLALQGFRSRGVPVAVTARRPRQASRKGQASRKAKRGS
jgi:hypothetical protein